MLVELPEPYSFELSTERYQRFGPDPAALWREDGVHRVLAGQEVRIEAAPGGVSITPAAAGVVADVERFLGAFFDLPASLPGGRGAGPETTRPSSPRSRAAP